MKNNASSVEYQAPAVVDLALQCGNYFKIGDKARPIMDAIRSENPVPRGFGAVKGNYRSYRRNSKIA